MSLRWHQWSKCTQVRNGMIFILKWGEKKLCVKKILKWRETVFSFYMYFSRTRWMTFYLISIAAVSAKLTDANIYFQPFKCVSKFCFLLAFIPRLWTMTQVCCVCWMTSASCIDQSGCSVCKKKWQDFGCRSYCTQRNLLLTCESCN